MNEMLINDVRESCWNSIDILKVNKSEPLSNYFNGNEIFKSIIMF